MLQSHNTRARERDRRERAEETKEERERGRSVIDNSIIERENALPWLLFLSSRRSSRSSGQFPQSISRSFRPVNSSSFHHHHISQLDVGKRRKAARCSVLSRFHIFGASRGMDGGEPHENKRRRNQTRQRELEREYRRKYTWRRSLNPLVCCR